MAAAFAVHVNNIGTEFELTFRDETGAPVDLTGQTALHFYFRLPNGTVLTKTPLFTSTGTDGKARYVTVAGDLTMPGLWDVQGYVAFPGKQFYSSKTTFLVQGNLA
jgi:hypothetical protein